MLILQICKIAEKFGAAFPSSRIFKDIVVMFLKDCPRLQVGNLKYPA